MLKEPTQPTLPSAQWNSSKSSAASKKLTSAITMATVTSLMRKLLLPVTSSASEAAAPWTTPYQRQVSVNTPVSWTVAQTNRWVCRQVEPRGGSNDDSRTWFSDNWCPSSIANLTPNSDSCRSSARKHYIFTEIYCNIVSQKPFWRHYNFGFFCW